jgi:hypothetical protein
MNAHTRTAGFSPSITPTISLRRSTRRLVLVAATFVIEAVIVLAFVSSSLGLGAAQYPDPDHGWATPAPSVPLAAPAAKAAPAASRASAPEPAPDPAPAPR